MTELSHLRINPEQHYLINYSLGYNQKKKEVLKETKIGQGVIYVSSASHRPFLNSSGMKHKFCYYDFDVHQNKSLADSTVISLACLILPYFVIKSICDAYLPIVPTWGIYFLSCFSYAPLCAAYHIFRIAIIPLKIITQIMKEIYEGKGVKTTLKKAAKVWLRETAYSIYCIPRAFVYGLIFNIGHLYALISPRKGMHFVSQIEQKWNHDIPVNQGYSLLSFFGLMERQRQTEGGWGDLNHFRPTAWYLLRCFQPLAKGTILVAPHKEAALEFYDYWQQAIQKKLKTLSEKGEKAPKKPDWEKTSKKIEKRVQEIKDSQEEGPIMIFAQMRSLGNNLIGSITKFERHSYSLVPNICKIALFG